MSLTILNNVAALYAQAGLNRTQASLQSTLQQLSSGSRINSGADDPSGLAVSDGMSANVTALTQSGTNAASGIGFLQTADGALAQVTSLLDQAITLATEASNGTLTGSQISSANQEYQNILTQIGNVGSATNFNSIKLFTSNATSIVVTDGTSSGTNLYSDTVGVLTKASVGTTVGTVIVSATIPGTTSAASIQSTPSVAGVSKSAGQYRLTAGANTDTLTGTISFSIGGGTQKNISLASDTLATVSNALTSAGLVNTVSNNVISITGPVAGVDAAANAVNFSGTALSFTPVATNLAAGSYGTVIAVPGSLSLGTLTFAGIPGYSTPSDTFGGTIFLSQPGESSATLTIAANSRIGPSTSSGTVEYQITQQLLGSPYSLAAVDGGNPADPVLDFSGGLNNTSPLTVTKGTFADTSRGGVSFATASPSNGNLQILQNTYTLGSLGFSSDTFGSGAANMLDINGTGISVAGMTAAAARLAINNTIAYQSAGISASVSSDGTTLTINGNVDGTALTVLGNGGGAIALTDQPQYDYPAPTGVIGSAVGNAASYGIQGSGTLTFSGANNGDNFGGTFTLSQGSDSLLVTISDASDEMSINNQIQTQLMSSVFHSSFEFGPNPTFQFAGAYDTTPITVTVGTLADSSTPSATFAGDVGTAGSAANQGTFILGALGSSSDTFGSDAGQANMLDINGTNVSIARMTATEAMQAINTNSDLQSAGITATINVTNTQITILGSAYGGPLTTKGYNGGALALTDQPPPIVPTGSVAQIAAPQGSPAGSGTSVITMGHSTDTLSGNLSVVVNGKTAALTVAANTTGKQLQDQINGDATFQGASLSAVYNSTNLTLTITGPAGAGNSLDTSGTSLTDTTASTQTVAGITPGAGADFTAAGVSVLTAASAGAILTKVTEAVTDVAYQRGTLGADINQLTSAAGVASVESFNLSSAQNSVSATDYGQAASNLSKYQILSQTGISALAQANTVQQEVLKLLQ